MSFLRRRDRGTFGDAGFTLVELMVTIACAITIAAIAAPRFQSYLLQTRLEGAKPYLAQIAAKQRMAKIMTGTYCCSGYNLDETTLANGLGLNLADTGDFCFVFICQNATSCAQTSGPGFITPITGGSANQPEFEVWAILANGTGQQTGPGSTKCTPVTGKANPTGWVNASGAGSAGHVVVLRYPPPVNGPGSTGSYHGVTFNWRDGTSTSDAMFR